MRSSVLFNFILALLLCLFSIGLPSPVPAGAPDGGAPALVERASSNSTSPVATTSGGGN
ncbi:hypothetical protein FRC10_005089, partial [Ceratobasidium sp. 414]